MSEQAFFILTVLVDGPCHGYGIVREVSDLSGGRVRLKIGGLYGLLDRLVSAGLIEPDREDVTDGRLRRYYRLTGTGRRTLGDEVDRLVANAGLAKARLRRSPRGVADRLGLSPRGLSDGAAS
jgi:PadR family transcriptional regulator, regulatory protein PadR